MKHERNIVPAKRPSWRLKKTLGRKIVVRPLSDDDLKYIWAAYRKGAMASVFPKEGMEAEEFRLAFDEIATRFSEGWIVEAETSVGYRPAGAIFAKADPILPYLIIAGIVWFPWATKRNVVEGTISFFDGMRRVMPCVGFAVDEHKRLYEVCCMHGIMRRVGTSCVAIPGKNAALFETRNER